ncbi:hypothetical protein [Marinobacterium sp. xm-d-564]|uniref:hypothetical protein n=1 Tax=Marinobacterium sp. xm-d-564 TaxID=2497742 RepID=UPI00156918FF|nr:hypothetical protein [Marinobacterium sp. xm-d-564]NRP60257.1 hypothetical protein [Marinobacterium sp. xm-d-564]
MAKKRNNAFRFKSRSEEAVYNTLQTSRTKISDNQWELLWAEIERLIELHFILKASYKHERNSPVSTRKTLEKLQRQLNEASKQLEDLSENQFRLIQQHTFLKQGIKSKATDSGAALTLLQFTGLINEVLLGVTGYKETLHESLPKTQGKQKDHSLSKFIFDLSEFIRSNKIPITVTDSEKSAFHRLIESIFEYQLSMKIDYPAKRISNALTFFEGPKK